MEKLAGWEFETVSDMPPIKVDLIEGYPYIWNPKDAAAIRKLHLTGALIGTLPRKPWQNGTMSLPLLLLPEEVTILKYLNKLVLTRSKEILVNADEEQCRKVNAYRRDSCRDQINIFVKGRNRKRKHFMSTTNSMGAENDSVKRKRLISGENTTNSDADPENNLSPDENNLHRKLPSSTHDIIATRDDTPSEDEVTDEDRHYFRNATWTLIPSTYNINSVESDEIQWHFPESLQDKLRYAVFFDLWKNGYYITGAEKFGADYLVYPSDPLRFHSYYIVHVKQKTDKVKFTDIVAYARLGNSVKKTVVYATVDSENDFLVKYNSMCWAGFN